MPNAASKLEPHRQFIATERRRGTTYRRIAALLIEKGVVVDYSTIHAFVKVRSKPRRTVITMLEADAENTSASEVSSPHALPGTRRIPEKAGSQLEAIRRLKNAKPSPRKAEKGLSSFKPDAPLDRLSEKEAKRPKHDLHR
jgi:hypothetical protein